MPSTEVIYKTRYWAQKKVDSINSQCIGTVWTDGITDNYCHIEERDGEFVVPILEGYERFFE
jgi:hypothetical protein